MTIGSLVTALLLRVKPRVCAVAVGALGLVGLGLVGLDGG